MFKKGKQMAKSAFEKIGVEGNKVEKAQVLTTVADKIIEQLAATGIKFIFGILISLIALLSQ